MALNLFRFGFDLASALTETAAKGYAFRADALSYSARTAMRREAAKLTLEVGDHVTNPIWPGTTREVRQLHARSYHAVDDGLVPVAAIVCDALEDMVSVHLGEFPLLAGWRPTEAGYQHYRGPSDHISPHRDRRNDQRLSVTFTLSGVAVVRVLEPVGDPDDYTNLRLVEEFLTGPGTTLFLRAPGFGDGGQVIHEVLPPTTPDGRLILNLRARPDVLPPP